MVVLGDGGRYLADSEGRLTNIKPCVELIQPEPGQVDGRADHSQDELITLVLKRVAVTEMMAALSLQWLQHSATPGLLRS